MEEPTSFREKLHAAIFRNDLPGQGWTRLILLVLSLAAAKALMRLIFLILLVAAAVVWFGRQGTDVQEVAKAHLAAEETARIVDEAQAQAEATRRAALIHQREEIIRHSTQALILAMISRHTEAVVQGGSGFTENIDDLLNYGFRPNPDLIYEVQSVTGANGDPSFTVLVRHRQEGPRAFRYDPDSGRGVEPVGPEPAEFASVTPETAPIHGYALEKVRLTNVLLEQEFAVKTALQQITFAQLAYRSVHGDFTSDYADLHAHGWRRDPALIYQDILLSQTLDGQPNFKVSVRHQARGPRAFNYDHSSGRGYEPIK